MKKYETFEELEAWKEGRGLRISISVLVKTFPVEEKYRLCDQLIRSSRSVTANIGEGFGRFYYQENIKFCRQARGSLLEVLDHLICAFDEEYISIQTLTSFKEKILLTQKILNGYIAFLKKNKNPES